jgi:formate dehydrogenase major subunit
VSEDIAQSDRNTRHVTAALEAMECIMVQDPFFTDTAKLTHVFFPDSSFREKNCAFTNAVDLAGAVGDGAAGRD